MIPKKPMRAVAEGTGARQWPPPRGCWRAGGMLLWRWEAAVLGAQLDGVVGQCEGLREEWAGGRKAAKPGIA